MTDTASSDLASVVVVNFNGRQLLDDLLEALTHQSYPHVEIIVVDNASSDGSADHLRIHWPHVRLLALPENLGFCGGSNRGMRAARGSFIALLNNDTVPAESWLAALVADLQANPDAGAVGSKILFLKPFLPLTLVVDTFNPAAEGETTDSRDLGVLFDEASGFENCDYGKRFFRRGFFGAEVIGGRTSRWTGAEAVVYLPVERPDSSASLHLTLSGGQSSRGRSCHVRIGRNLLGSFELSDEFALHRFRVTRDTVRAHAFDVINNAGSLLSPEGETGDRGIFEVDRGQYNRPGEIEALCGASVLLRRKALAKVGGFDPDFFMYYEDTDLSWRLKRSGFRLRYEPASVVRHVHAAASEEGSALFRFFVARNHLLLLAKNGPLLRLAAAYLQRLLITLRLILTSVRSLGDPADSARKDLLLHLRLQRSLFLRLPRALLKRVGILPAGTTVVAD